MNLFKSDEAILSEIRGLKKQVAELQGTRDGTKEAVRLEDQIIDLKKKVVELEIQKDKKQEEFDRRERELTHMIGLEKKRQEVETKQAATEARLAVREENLKAEQERFDDQMEFREKRFEEQVTYLQDLMSKILERLPTVTVDREITDRRPKVVSSAK